MKKLTIALGLFLFTAAQAQAGILYCTNTTTRVKNRLSVICSVTNACVLQSLSPGATRPVNIPLYSVASTANTVTMTDASRQIRVVFQVSGGTYLAANIYDSISQVAVCR